jgi:hypothetical protein
VKLKFFESTVKPVACTIITRSTDFSRLKKIRWRHFLSDCTPLMTDYVVIKKQLEQEINNAKSFLDENYRDILENFDPNVVKLGKKRKVIMSAKALDDLVKLNNYDEPIE